MLHDDPPASPPWLKAAPSLFLLLWSCGFVFVKLGLAHADPLTFLALRYACVVALLAPVALWRRPPLPAGGRAWIHLAVVGLLLQAGYFCSVYLSFEWGMSAGGLALITSQQPILIGLLAPALTGERVGLRRWAGLILGVAGAVLVIAAKSTVEITGGGALWFALSGLLALTAGTLWEKRFGTDVHPLTANLVQYVVGLGVAAPLAFAFEPMHVEWAPSLLLSLAYLVVGNSIVAISLLLVMIRRGEASRVSALFFLVPPLTALIAYLLLGEDMPPLAWPGMIMAAAGLYLVMRKEPARA